MATMAPQPGWRTRSTAGCPRSRAASSRALAWARSTRRCRVRSPRSASQTSIGPAIAPCRVRWVEQPLRGGRGRPPWRGVTTAPSSDVAVAGEVLGHRVHDDVGAELERALEQRRGEGVVDDGEHAALAGGAPAGWGGRRPRAAGWSATRARAGRRRRAPAQHRVGVGDVDAAHHGRPLGLARGEGGERCRCRPRRARRRCRRGGAARAPPSRPPCRRRARARRRPRGRRARPRTRVHVGLPERA